MKQKAFTTDYTEELEDNISSNCENYSKLQFEYDSARVLDMPFESHEGLLDEMTPFLSTEAKVEVDAAIKLYEAYKDLTPLQASHRPFWIYLSHVDLFPYMRERWLVKDVPEGEKLVDHIKSHWFYKNGKLRSHLEGMYWLVRQSVKYHEDGIPDYTETRFLFSRRVLGDRGIAARQFIFRNERIFRGIIEYIMKNEDTIFAHHMQARATYCASLLNSKGGVVELSTWDENDVERYLDQHKHEIELQDND
jgi:hypothetical protein